MLAFSNRPFTGKPFFGMQTRVKQQFGTSTMPFARFVRAPAGAAEKGTPPTTLDESVFANLPWRSTLGTLQSARSNTGGFLLWGAYGSLWDDGSCTSRMLHEFNMVSPGEDFTHLGSALTNQYLDGFIDILGDGHPI